MITKLHFIVIGLYYMLDMLNYEIQLY